MPKFLLKVSPDRDAYIEWSTIVDAPVQFGTREECVEEFGEERVARTDRNGTSALYFHWLELEDQEGGWRDEHLTVMNGAEVTGLLPRSRLSDLYDLLDNDPEALIPAEWIEPFEHDGEEDEWLIGGHGFQPVAGHPDDDECTHREDGTDDTYCGRPRSCHTT